MQTVDYTVANKSGDALHVSIQYMQLCFSSSAYLNV